MSNVKTAPKMGDKEKEQFDRLLNDDSSSDVVEGVVYPKPSWRRNSGVFLTYASFTFLAIVSVVLVGVTSGNIVTSNKLLAQARDEIVNLRALTATHSQPAQTDSAKLTGEEFGHCGSTIAEARRLGCVFDSMSWAWQRPECYHAELVDDFLTRMDWKLYPTNDTANSQPVSREAWERGDYVTLHADRAWHFFHCMYSWRKFHEAFEKRMPMDNDIAMFGHTMHCDGVFLHNLDPELIGTWECDSWPGGCQTIEVTAGFNKCGWY